MMDANITPDAPVDDIARNAAHDALGIQVYPGTEIMTDGTALFMMADRKRADRKARIH